MGYKPSTGGIRFTGTGPRGTEPGRGDCGVAGKTESRFHAGADPIPACVPRGAGLDVGDTQKDQDEDQDHDQAMRTPKRPQGQALPPR